MFEKTYLGCTCSRITWFLWIGIMNAQNFGFCLYNCIFMLSHLLWIVQYNFLGLALVKCHSTLAVSFRLQAHTLQKYWTLVEFHKFKWCQLIHNCWIWVQIFTSCYLGFIRLMDVEKEIFDLVYSSEDPICSLSQRSDDVKCLYFSEGYGRLNIWDERVRKCSTQSKIACT